MRRLVPVLFVSILLILGLRWVWVVPAEATSLKQIIIPSSQDSPPISKIAFASEIYQRIILDTSKTHLAIRSKNKHDFSKLDIANLTLKVLAPRNTYQENLPKQVPQGVHGLGISLNVLEKLSAPTVLSQDKTLNTVLLNLVGPDQVKLTDPIVLAGFLKDTTTDTMVSNKTITFSTDGDYLAQTHTNDQGAFTIKINKDLTAGKYLITASFKGAHLLAPATAAVWLQVLPATIRVQTVPAIAGITFQMDGRQFVSGQDGQASINIDQSGTYRLDVLLDQYHNPSQQVEFGRWSQESYQPFRELQVPDDEVIQVGLNLFHKMSMKFVDLDGLPVDSSRITSISIRSIQGDVFTLKPGDTPWLPAGRTARRQTGLEETQLLYSVNSVMIDGSNVVNSAQQRFYVNTDDTWTISLLLYSLRVTAKDGLFASPIGTSVNIVLPNGQTQNYPLNKSGVLEIHSLARGIYRVSLLGVKGLGTSTPVALSRNQVVNFKIVTVLDLAVIGMMGLLVAIGLILYGRPRLLNVLLGRKHKSSNSKVSLIPKHEN
jgi:hypothetical protein